MITQLIAYCHSFTKKQKIEKSLLSLFVFETQMELTNSRSLLNDNDSEFMGSCALVAPVVTLTQAYEQYFSTLSYRTTE